MRQRAKAVILSANGSESARLLLMSKSSRFPDGLANSSGVVGKHAMFGNVVKTYGDPAYTSLVLAVLTFIGLLLMRESRKYVVAE